MEVSLKLSMILEVGGDYGKFEEFLELYIYYLDCILCKEGYRVGVYWMFGDYYCGEWYENKCYGERLNFVFFWYLCIFYFVF